MATSRSPPHLITTSLGRRPLRASPAPFLMASSCLARSSRHSTTPTVQAPPFLPNPAPSPLEALKVDLERGERSQARHSALDSSHTSLSFTHLFIYYLLRVDFFFFVLTLFFSRDVFCLFISTVYLFPLYVFVQLFGINQPLCSLCLLFYMCKFFLPLLKQIKLYLFYIFF